MTLIIIIMIIINIHMKECVLRCYKKTGVKLNQEQLCEYVRTKIGRTKSWKRDLIVMESTSEKWQSHL